MARYVSMGARGQAAAGKMPPMSNIGGVFQPSVLRPRVLVYRPMGPRIFDCCYLMPG